MLLLIALTLILSLVDSSNGQGLRTSRFIKEEILCDVEESVRRGCSKEVRGVRSRLECTILCLRDTECLAASLDPQDKCLHHQLCHTAVPCPQGMPDVGIHAYMARYCLHGTWDSPSQSCICHYGTYGVRCNKYHRFCDGLIQAGFSNGNYLAIIDPLQDGVSLIKVRLGIALPSYCNIKVMSNWGRLNFNRTWAEYVNGFQISEYIDDFWIGLRPWHILNTFGAKILLTLMDFKNGGTIYAKYYNAYLTTDGSDYSLTGNLYSMSPIKSGPTPHGVFPGNCLSPLKGVSFSTLDRARDGSGGKDCAAMAGYGWWFKDDCDNPCHLLGWGLDDYSSTPPAQRLTFLGADVAQHADEIKQTLLVLEL